jgi:hypothetical protein
MALVITSDLFAATALTRLLLPVFKLSGGKEKRRP